MGGQDPSIVSKLGKFAGFGVSHRWEIVPYTTRD